MMNYGTVSVILEVEKSKSKAYDNQRFLKALHDLYHSSIKGRKVISVLARDTDSCYVPHFGHDASCGKKCDNKEDTVVRYFGIDLIMENPSNDLFGLFKLNKHSQIQVSGVPVPIEERDRKELKFISSL